MAKKTQHVVRREIGWAVRGQGKARDTSRQDTQAQPIDAARDIARNQRSEVVIHDRQGRIRDRESYATTRTRRRTGSTDGGRRHR